MKAEMILAEHEACHLYRVNLATRFIICK